MDSPDITSIGVSIARAAPTAIEPCNSPAPACSSTACIRPVICV
jgi:hypothetical protein